MGDQRESLSSHLRVNGERACVCVVFWDGDVNEGELWVPEVEGLIPPLMKFPNEHMTVATCGVSMLEPRGILVLIP